MGLRRIVISEVHDHQLVQLREMEGSRRFTIVIGLFEATSIDRRVRKQKSERPLTHDLVACVVEEMGGEIRDIVISDLRDGIYFAKLRVMVDGEIREIDCRPSDALAVAVTAEVPIYVADEVLDEVSNE
jgi:bifunctional DNase/RNase